VAVKIRLKRMGKIRQPYYRIVVADSRTKRDGRVIEEIGKYHPKEDPSFIEVNSDRAQYWLGVGAQPSEPVTAILKVTGDWQKFKGEAAPAPMKVAEPKRDKAEIFNDALKDAQSEPKSEATTPRRSAAKKAAPVDEAPAETAEVEEAVAEVESSDAAAPVEQSSPLESEAAAEGAEAGDAPEGAAVEETPVEETPAESTDEKA
jgi:small subunit ribosomal protein S16